MPDISRADALALINVQEHAEIFQEAVTFSAALASFRSVPMSAKQTRMRLIDTLPTAGWVSTDSGRKLTTEVIWGEKVMEAEEMALIVPIPENVFDDVSYNVWGEVRPRVAEAFGAILDAAVFFGTNAPSTFPDSLAEGAIAASNSISRSGSEGRLIGSATLTAAGNVVTTSVDHGLSIGDTVVLGTITTTTGVTAGTVYYVRTTAAVNTLTLAATAGGAAVAFTGNGSTLSVTETGAGAADVSRDLAYTVSEAMGQVEDDGFDPNVLYARRTLRRELRNMRDANGNLLYAPNLTGGVQGGSIWGLNINYSTNNAWANAGLVKAIVGDSTKAIIGLRQDMQFKILTEATLTDGAGNVVFSLAEQDMIALRVKFRVGFQVADPTTVEGGSTAYPFAVVVA